MANLTAPKATKSLLNFTQEYKPKRYGVVSEKLYAEKGKTKFRPIFAIANLLH